MLILKHLPISSFSENLAYVHKDCISYKIDEISSLTKIEIHGGMQPIYAFLQVVEDENIVNPNEIALNNEAFQQISLPEGANVTITLSPPAPSLSYVKKKINGNILSESEYKAIIKDIGSRRYSNTDIASFLVASGSFMSATEVLAMTNALVSDRALTWDDEGIVVDQHCLGGVPGNKTDIIVMAIVAAYGLPMPKTASRSLTSCAGVADTFGVLANVELDDRKFQQLVKENRAAVAYYNALSISEVNKLVFSIERQLGIVKQEHVVASMLAMKKSAGITHLLVDIPVGRNSRIKSTNEAMHLRKLIEYIGDMSQMVIDVVITDGAEPVGNGVGPVLEARDVMQVLRCNPAAPQDLKEKSLFLAGRILDFDPKLRGGQGYAVAQELLKSGKALEAMNRIMNAQGKYPQPQLGHLTRDIVSSVSGVVEAIDNSRIIKIGVWAGAGQHPDAGVDLFKKVGDMVQEGDILYRIYSCSAADFALANSIVNADNGYKITKVVFNP